MSKSIKKWLEKLDLGQYVDLFAENDIDWELLGELDHESLKDIGITSTGHRLRIIKAVALLAKEAIDVAPVADNGSTPTAFPSVRTQAERRQLTVMFCDLVGSTNLSGRLDPEDLREVVRAYQQTVAKEVKRFDGHVVQYLGDGVLIYFGYPVAHEDDPQRAVYAGLGVSRSMAALNTRLQSECGVQLSVRIGIHTGPVVVGKMGDSDHQENLAMGETPNLAARLQGLAETGAVLISDSTRRLLGELFDLAPLGAQNLKGICFWECIIFYWDVLISQNRVLRRHYNTTTIPKNGWKKSPLLIRKPLWQRGKKSN